MKPLSEHARQFAEDDHCPQCHHGIVEHAEFGVGDKREIWSKCMGLDNDEDSGCGWEERYVSKHDNEKKGATT